MIFDLFAGPGGWDEGLRTLGVTDVLGLELDEDACATAEAAGHARLQCDVTEIDPADYAGITGLIASPPCQEFSSAGPKGGYESDRGSLVDEVLRWVSALKPRWIALEQVPGVLPIWQRNAYLWSLKGYSCWTGLLNSVDYGVPQRRKRAFLVASLDGTVGAPPATHASGGLFGSPYVTVADVLDVPTGWWIDRRNNSRGPQGASVPVAPVPCSRPAPTVTGQAGGGQWLLCAPDGSTRNLTVAEAARLQGFPDGYPWQGTKASQAQQVGNAVPPPLAAAVLTSLIAAEEVAA